MLKTLILAVTFVAVCRSCNFDTSCKTTYIHDASNGDACTAANAYQTCVNAMTSSCNATQKAEDPYKTAIDESNSYVANNCNSGPPPPPPPGPGGDGGAPATSCYSPTCESTYTTNVAQGDACAAAEAYVNCVGQMVAACGATIPPEVTSTQQAAQAAQVEKCNGPPVPPQPATSCYSAACESTYTTNVAQGDACAAAEAYLNCVGQMVAACGATIPPEVTSTQQAAQAAQVEKCSGPPVPPGPSSCTGCDSYNTQIQTQIQNGAPPGVTCPIRVDHVECLRRCNAPAAEIENIVIQNAMLCGNYIKDNCTILYMHCDIGLPILHLQNPTSVCDLWNICAAKDFSLCGERLNHNYSAVCDPLKPPVPPPQPTDNSSPPPGQGPQPTDNSSPPPGQGPQPTDNSSPPPVQGPQPTDGSSPSPQQPQASVNNDKNKTPTLGPVTVVVITAFLAAFLCSTH
ncbi:hypothetical protein SNE40_004220 [Patella caerulea]|uniref:Uncharacterized protein n=1 Tax=Patella caerulea TaxID=87958 RepID=A0AAN8KG08_PATCE